MANSKIPRSRGNVDHAGNLAAISLAGIRIFVQSSVAPGAGAAATYTVTDANAHRLLAFHNSGANTDIRMEQGGTAVATDMPMASGVYVAFEVEKDDTVSFFNTTAGGLTVYVVELG